MRALIVVALIGGAVLWYVSHRTDSKFEKTAEARAAGGHSILKADPEPQAVKVVGSIVNTEDLNAVYINGHTEDCAAGSPGCFQADALLVLHNADRDQVRRHATIYRGSHYYLGSGALTNEEGNSRIVEHFGSLAEAKRAR